MKWYKRFSDFSVSHEAFRISPLGHLLYTVLSDMVCRSGKDGCLPAKSLDSTDYLARLCNIRLVSAADIESAFCDEASGVTREQVLSLSVTDAGSLKAAFRECLSVGLILRVDDDFYALPGFTTDNPIFLNPETIRKQNQRRKQQESWTVPGQDRDCPPLEEKRRDKKEKKEKKRKDASASSQDSIEPDKGKGSGDLKSLQTALIAIYSDVRGEPYVHQGAKDIQALKRLLGAFKGNDIESRWRRGLLAVGYLQTNSFAQLAMKWNDLSGVAQAKPGQAVQSARQEPRRTMADVERAYEMKAPMVWGEPQKNRDTVEHAEVEADGKGAA